MRALVALPRNAWTASKPHLVTVAHAAVARAFPSTERRSQRSHRRVCSLNAQIDDQAAPYVARQQFSG
jgi:hypothetical protein